MTSPPAGGPAPHGAGPAPHDLWWQDVTPYEYPPAVFPVIDVRPSEAELAEFAAEWRRRFQATDWRNRVRAWPPLPRRTRLKLAIHRHITAIGCWLGGHVS